MQGHPIRGIYAYEQLSLARSRQPDLHVDVSPITESFIMCSAVEFRVCPFPEDIASKSHMASRQFRVMVSRVQI
ncbi:hypothetical protein PS718_01696 [Pseudomonas fluorescens]|uniref:Uncharacterized protein n=1 Tax=Pseudomonas fluorescens TaxID=294 RepID=A0A5E7BC00_PSEFL|nr:hypothetical protein PS718_01696 [Pseudomonas fluorescens]